MHPAQSLKQNARAAGTLPNGTLPKRSGGFTLLELLVVVAIIGILASLVIGVTSGIAARRKKILATVQVKEIEEAAKQYYRDWQVYPPDTDVYEANDPAPQGLSSGDLKYAIHRYLGQKLQDPNSGETHGPYLDIKESALKEGATVDGKYAQLYVDPWGNPYEMDCRHATRDPKTHKVSNESFPYAPGTPDEKLVLEVKVWSAGPDGKATAKAPFYPDPKADEDLDNVMSWASSEK
jgi:general secretion pathway protein G